VDENPSGRAWQEALILASMCTNRASRRRRALTSDRSGQPEYCRRGPRVRRGPQPQYRADDFFKAFDFSSDAAALFRKGAERIGIG
jgi:hypothetical protein